MFLNKVKIELDTKKYIAKQFGRYENFRKRLDAIGRFRILGIELLRTFALIVYAHPYCARNSCRNATPRHASSARAEETFQPHIGRVDVAITSLAVC